MKPKTNQKRLKETFGGVCRATCHKVLTEITRAKAAALAEWSDTLKTQQHILQLALNEAEALAWQTLYPHLVFPVLATEKLQAVAAWNRRQRRLWWNNPPANR